MSSCHKARLPAVDQQLTLDFQTANPQSAQTIMNLLLVGAAGLTTAGLAAYVPSIAVDSAAAVAVSGAVSHSCPHPPALGWAQLLQPG